MFNSCMLRSKHVSILLMLGGLFLLGNASYIHLKAALAQVLIANAYAKQVKSQDMQKPWPWADTQVSAKLTIKGRSDYVLSDASGRNLAFGPAHVASTAMPGTVGNSVIVGHRDTHFAHLEGVQIGETIQLEKGGVKIEYQVLETAVVNENDTQVMAPLSSTALTLITCYPFNDISPNPHLRYVIRAIKIS